MVFDPDVHRIPQLQPDWGDLIVRQLTLLTQLDEGATAIIKATALMTGLTGRRDRRAHRHRRAGAHRRAHRDRPPDNGIAAAAPAEEAPSALRPEAVLGRWKDFLAET